MIVKAHQTFSHRGEGDPPVRLVDVPDFEFETKDIQVKLDKIYYYGQNEIQPDPQRASLAVGDVIELSGLWRVLPQGFCELDENEKLTDFIGLEAHSRANKIWLKQQGLLTKE